ncbi:DUF4167 domain-containing protein [Candidatus Puniceispirillum sp.]|nr:DUF4167 domain-containing protein [Candidatus Puniceispirillum sp.]
MRQPQNAKRGRSRGRRGNNNSGHNYVPNRNTSYESNGPDVKLRGNAQQLHEKYMALAQDASTSGERIPAEAFAQFADHYFRLHQAAVGVAETKRQQDHADAAAVAADEPRSVDSIVAAESDNTNCVEPVSAQLEITEANGLAAGNSADAEKVSDVAPKARPNLGKNKTRASVKSNAEGAKPPSDQLGDTVQSNQETDQAS